MRVRRGKYVGKIGESNKSNQNNHYPTHPRTNAPSLPIPTRDEIINSPIQDSAPPNGSTSNYTMHGHGHGGGHGGDGTARPSSPIMEDPGAEMERELAAGGAGRGY
jgi:hypothetical protein